MGWLGDDLSGICKLKFIFLFDLFSFSLNFFEILYLVGIWMKKLLKRILNNLVGILGENNLADNKIIWGHFLPTLYIELFRNILTCIWIFCTITAKTSITIHLADIG